MTISQPDTTSFYGRVASLLGRKVSRPDARKAGIAISNEIVALSHLDREAVLQRLGSSKDGLDAGDAAARLRTMGANSITQEEQPSIFRELLGRAKNPLNGLLLSLAFISYLLGDLRAAIVIGVMVVLAIGTAFIQEHRSNNTAAKLRAMVKNTASVKRRGLTGDAEKSSFEGFTEIPSETLVSGDIVHLSAGDMIPGDLLLLDAKDLFVNEATLTGEALPAEKRADPPESQTADPFECPNLCFMGASVVSGYATGVIVHTGPRTYFGQLAESIAGQRELTSFDKGINRFTWLMIRFILVMVPAVFLINGITKGDWLEALLFSVAVAVGLTPEMLPMIVTVNLAKGAMAMAKKRVIVKRLHAIQNFGAMNVLCTDKTGTLTQDRIILKRNLDIRGNECERVLEFAYLNSHYQSGLKNLLDTAVLAHVELGQNLILKHRYEKIDEMPFDFMRRRLSIVLKKEDGSHILICKGAVEEVFAVSRHYELDGKLGDLDAAHYTQAQHAMRALNEDGFRVVAVAYKKFPQPKAAYSVEDESDLTLLGYIAFLDPPKDSASAAIAALHSSGVAVKILTGDNEIITAKICREVGLDAGRIVLGSEIEKMDDRALTKIADATTVFAKLSPPQKARVIAALHANGHVVGYLGDGINDTPALKAADVGVSVDTAVDIARESADIILLEKDLMVLQDGVIEGRRVFGNITKYIKMGASSNFGNMFSVLGASIFLPFLPMTAIQVLTNNLLYDFSQTAIPTDHVDAEYLTIPRKWDIDNIFKFMIFIGPISSIFDYVTFFVMLTVFNAWANPPLFQTGWFVESLLTQTLIIHIIRTAKIPFIQSRASTPLIATTIAVCAAGIALPFTWVGEQLGFTTLPHSYWFILAATLLSYATLTHLVKTWFIRRWGM
jgi:Mg2+-importing ATPase